MTHSAISRWILRNEELASASLSKAAASFVYAILCTLQSAHIIMLIAFIVTGNQEYIKIGNEATSKIATIVHQKR